MAGLPDRGGSSGDARSDIESPGAVAAAVALTANAGIFAAKTVVFLLTGAASMLAESIHSAADTANQSLLLLGAHGAKQKPDPRHPFGYARLRYFWAFVVSVVLFTVGGVVSLLEGVEKLRSPHAIRNIGWALAVLAVSAVFEGASLLNAVRSSRSVRNGRSWRRFVAEVSEPELPVVLLEDTAALAGLAAAFGGIVVAHVTGEPRWDAAGSIAIGSMLMGVAFVLGREMKGMLVGEAAPDAVVVRVRAAIAATPGVANVRDLRTQQLGPHTLLVVASVTLAEENILAEVAAALSEAKARLRAEVPDARYVYLEPAVHV